MPRKRKRDDDEELRELLTNWPHNLAEYQRTLCRSMRAQFVQKSVAPLARLTDELELHSTFSELMARASRRPCDIPAKGRRLLSLVWTALVLYQDTALLHELWDYYYRINRVVSQFVLHFPETRNARILGREMRRWNSFLVQPPLFVHMTNWLCQQHALPAESDDLRRGEQMLLDVLELWYESPLSWKCFHRQHGGNERACRSCATHHRAILRALGNLVRQPWCDLDRAAPLLEIWLKHTQPDLRDLRALHHNILESIERAPHDLVAQVWLLHALLQLPVEVRRGCARQAHAHLTTLSEASNFMPVDASAVRVADESARGAPSLSTLLVDMSLEALAPHLARVVHAEEDVALLARVTNQCAYLAWRYPQNVKPLQIVRLVRRARAALPRAFDATVKNAPNYRACHWQGVDEVLAEEKAPSPPHSPRFLCALTCELMRNPVKLPQSGEVLDASSLARHLAISQTDPYTLTPLTMDQVEPQDLLRKEIEATTLGSRLPRS